MLKDHIESDNIRAYPGKDHNDTSNADGRSAPMPSSTGGADNKNTNTNNNTNNNANGNNTAIDDDDNGDDSDDVGFVNGEADGDMRGLSYDDMEHLRAAAVESDAAMHC